MTSAAAFDLVRYRRHDHAAVLCAFDLLEHEGGDLRRMPIEERKGFLAKLLSRPLEGIAFNQHFACGGAILFKHACEGIVSKRLGSAYSSDRADCWVKVKNPAAASAVRREAEEDWDGRRRRRQADVERPAYHDQPSGAGDQYR